MHARIRASQLAATVLLTAVLHASAPPAPRPAALPLRPGVYLTGGGTCAQAAFAQIIFWDGAGFSDPHSARCVTTESGSATSPYRIQTTCSALGDGTPTKPDTQQQTLWIRSRSSFSLGAPGATTQAAATPYRWSCTKAALSK